MINRDEWMTALKEAGMPAATQDPNAITASEFATLIGLSKGTARARLQVLVEQGLAEQVTKRVADGHGRVQLIHAYRLKPKRKPR